MYGCESWTIKKAECWRIDALKLWCWRRLLRVPWTTRRSKHSILKEIYLEYSLKGLMLKLKLQCETPDAKPTHWKRPWCWERLKAGGDGDDKGRDGWMASVTQWTWVWAHSRRWWRTGKPGVLQSVGSQRVRHWATKQLEGEDACGEQRLKPSKTWSRQGEDLSRIFDATAGFTDQSLPRPAPGLGKKREL